MSLDTTKQSGLSAGADASWNRVVESDGLTLRTENAPSRVLESFSMLALRGGLRDLFAADVRMADHRQPPINPVRNGIDLLQLVDELGEVGDGVLAAELLAARGDSCGLLYTALAGPEGKLTSMLVVAECGANGLLTEVALYDLADLADAVERMVALYARQLPARELATLRPTAAVGNAVARRDFDALDRLLSDDFEHRDCRDRPCLTVRRPRVLDCFRAILSADEPDVMDIVTEIHKITERGLVASRTQLSVHAPVVEETDVVLVGVKGDHLDKMEFYAHDDLAVALARLDQLSAASS